VSALCVYAMISLRGGLVEKPSTMRKGASSEGDGRSERDATYILKRVVRYNGNVRAQSWTRWADQ